MPLRRELRKYYGRTHRAYRAALIATRGAKCPECGRDMPRYLNLCHLQHDPARSGLVALMCPACHARHDARHSYAVRRRSRARATGQGWLLPELEYAPYAASEIPDTVLRALQAAAQRGLFE
jgi:hypothetical protein